MYRILAHTAVVLHLAGSALGAELPQSLDLTRVRTLPVQHDGRYPPIDTLARDVVQSVTGEIEFNDQDPVLLLLGWTFEPEVWSREPLIPIGNAELRRELELSPDRTRFSYSELVSHGRLLNLIRSTMRRSSGRKMDALESKVLDINAQLITLQDALFGDSIRLVPDPDDPSGSWRTISEAQRAGYEEIVEAWSAMGRAFANNDPTTFTSGANRLIRALDDVPAADRPAPALLATELHYNELNPWRRAWIVMWAGAVLAVLAAVFKRRWLDALAGVGLLAGFILLSYGLYLRWQIADRIPAANMFESLLFLSWGMGAFAVVSTVILRHRVVPLTAAIIGALSLMLADITPLDGFIRPVVPVLLDTYWMSIHVPIIMVSYSVLAAAVLIAHGQIIGLAVAPQKRVFAEQIDRLHYWYVMVGTLLLLAGIITGSMWAASSWGRYWGWDPKEVWSLVAFLGYMAILHIRVDRDRMPLWAYFVGLLLAVVLFVLVALSIRPVSAAKLGGLGAAGVAVLYFVFARGPFATAAKSIAAFWLIIMTYLGVNYVLGIGLHSYGFGKGAMVRYMLLTGTADMALVLICGVLYLLRRSPGFAPPANAPIGSGT